MNQAAGDSVIVVGGGVVGAMCAWYLSQAGMDVTIVEKNKFGSGCSHGNCGYVSPSHILPLTQPGAVKKTLRGMLNSNSAFKVKPRMSMGFFKWFWNFARRCNHKNMMDSAAGLHAILQSSRQLYDELINGHDIQCEWQSKGLFFVFDTEKEFNDYKTTNELLTDNFGVSAKPYPCDQLIEMEPALKPVFAGAWFYDCDSHIRPDLLMSSMKNKLTERGVTIIENANVTGFVKQQGRAVAVQTDRDSIAAKHIVVATGAWTPFLNDHLGCKIPIEPGKGYSITMPTPARMPKYPMIFETTHVAVTPMQSKYRIGSTMEFVGFDSSINRKRIELLKTSAAKYLHEPYCEPIEEQWYGWRPMTWDSKPIIDRCPALANVWIAAGHNMLGLSTATATGLLITELITDQSPHIDPTHFAIARFQ
jgi:D-amino-acid dehydrogenase